MRTIRHKLDLEVISFILIAVALSVFLVAGKNNFKFNFVNFSIPQIAPSITPTPIPPKTSTIAQISEDGLKKLIMKTTVNKNYSQTYSFFTESTENPTQHFIFQKTVDPTQTMSVPFNAWSPDDKYFFVVQHSPTKNDALVFKGSGEPFSNTESFYDVTDIFDKRNTGYTFDEATGWASETLIIINTKSADGSKGSSFWFEVPTKAIIQLSTQF